MKTRTVIANTGEWFTIEPGQIIEVIMPMKTSESDLDITLDFDSSVEVTGDTQGSFYSSNTK